MYLTDRIAALETHDPECREIVAELLIRRNIARKAASRMTCELDEAPGLNDADKLRLMILSYDAMVLSDPDTECVGL